MHLVLRMIVKLTLTLGCWFASVLGSGYDNIIISPNSKKIASLPPQDTLNATPYYQKFTKKRLEAPLTENLVGSGFHSPHAQFTPLVLSNPARHPSFEPFASKNLDDLSQFAPIIHHKDPFPSLDSSSSLLETSPVLDLSIGPDAPFVFYSKKPYSFTFHEYHQLINSIDEEKRYGFCPNPVLYETQSPTYVESPTPWQWRRNADILVGIGKVASVNSFAGFEFPTVAIGIVDGIKKRYPGLVQSFGTCIASPKLIKDQNKSTPSKADAFQFKLESQTYYIKRRYKHWTIIHAIGVGEFGGIFFGNSDDADQSQVAALKFIPSAGLLLHQQVCGLHFASAWAKHATKIEIALHKVDSFLYDFLDVYVESDDQQSKCYSITR